VTGGLGGLPARRPDQTRDYPPTGVQPGSGNVVRARLIIISGTAGGLFVYDGTPALGNPPIVSATAASTDPYGNPVTPGLDVTQGSITGTLISASQIDGTTITGSVFEGTNFTLNDDGLFIYSGAPGSPLVASVAAADGTDTEGNAYLDGFASYAEAGGAWYASQLYGGDLAFWIAPSAAGPWTQQGEVQVSPAGNLLLTPAGASVVAGGPLDVDGGITAQGGITWESPGLSTYAAEGGSGASFNVNTVTTATPGTLTEETIPSGDPVAGSIYRLTAFGEGQWSSAQEQLNLFLNLAGNAVAEVAIGATAFADSATFWWEADGTVCCQTTGATATWTGRLRITVTQTANAATGFNSAANSVTAAGNTGSATVTASTEAAAVFQLAAEWAATTGAPTISKYTSYFEKVF
jgi:hypothetical protein